MLRRDWVGLGGNGWGRVGLRGMRWGKVGLGGRGGVGFVQEMDWILGEWESVQEKWGGVGLGQEVVSWFRGVWVG